MPGGREVGNTFGQGRSRLPSSLLPVGHESRGSPLSIKHSNPIAAEILRDLWVAVVAFDPRWRVVLWNPQAEALFGIPEADAIGLPVEETGILSGLGPIARLKARIDGAGELIVPGTGPAAAGSPRTLLHRVRRLDDVGAGHLGYLSLSRPLAEEGSSRDRELGEILGLTPNSALAPATGAVADEMRHPLQVLLHTGELLLQDTDPGEPDTVGARVRGMVRAAEELTRLLHRLDDLARSVEPQVAPGRAVPEPSEVRTAPGRALTAAPPARPARSKAL